MRPKGLKGELGTLDTWRKEGGQRKGSKTSGFGGGWESSEFKSDLSNLLAFDFT